MTSKMAGSRSEAGWKPTDAGAHLRGRVTADTQPELALRRSLHALGLRYRLNRRLGKYRPDIVFPGSHTAVFVDGCFWHGCPVHGADEFRGPNAEMWKEKLDANRERDRRSVTELEETGWSVVRVWECEIKNDVGSVAQHIRTIVQDPTASSSP